MFQQSLRSGFGFLEKVRGQDHPWSEDAGQTLGPTFWGCTSTKFLSKCFHGSLSLFSVFFLLAWHQSHSEGFRIKRNMSLRNQDGPGDLGWLAGWYSVAFHHLQISDLEPLTVSLR